MTGFVNIFSTNYNLRLPLVVCFINCKSPGFYRYFSNLVKIAKPFLVQNFFLKKKDKFTVNSKNSVFFQKNITSFFTKPQKAVVFFGLKHAKNTRLMSLGKPQMKLQDLNFTTENLFSLNRDLGLNPCFGNVSRGFSKLLGRVSLKEYLNVFLRPKWYRLAKFQNFKQSVFRKEKRTELFHDTFFLHQSNSNDFYFFYKFFIKKRWFLLYVLKK